MSLHPPPDAELSKQTASERAPGTEHPRRDASDGRRTAACWAGAFDDPEEIDCEISEREGRLPDELRGTLYRNGPGSRRYADSFFDGDGMIRALAIQQDGGVRLRMRHVRTKKFLLESRRGRHLVRTAGTNRPGGILANFGRIPGHEANTHVVEHAGRLLALEEGGHPYEIDPETLETGEMLDFDGVLPRFQPYSAHPHTDAGTGETLNFGMDFTGLRPTIQTFHADSRGRVSKLSRAPLPYASFVHDFALSPRYMVFYVPPITASVVRFALGLDSFFGNMQWHDDLAGRFLLIPRDGGAPIELETDSFLVGHFLGAWEQGDEVVVDICRLDSWAGIAEAAMNYDTSDWEAFSSSKISRYRIDLSTGRIASEVLCPLPADFPRLHPDVEATASHWGFAGANTSPGEPGFYHAALKLDRRTGATDLFDFGRNKTSLEPVFAPRPGATDEDDGWVLCWVYDSTRRANEIAILDGRCLADGPVCTIPLPVNTGATFHGCWIPGDSTP